MRSKYPILEGSIGLPGLAGLKAARVRARLTQGELSDRCEGTSVTDISLAEDYGIRPGIDKLIDLARALQVSTDELLGLCHDEQK